MILVSALQMASTDQLDENFTNLESGLKQASKAGSQLCVTPEETLTLGMTDEQKLALSKQSTTLISKLSKLCQQYKINLIVGSVPVEYDDKHYQSTCLAFDSQGTLLAQYHKIHLFDVQVSDGVQYKESAFVHPGENPCIVEMPFGVIGLSICYDVRFPNHYQKLSQLGAQIIVIPSAFTPQTGRVHWDLLVRARAVENLCYVVAPNQCGLRANGQGTYGHSCIVHPWGERLATAKEQPTLIHAEIDLQQQAQIRADFPVLEHRKS